MRDKPKFFYYLREKGPQKLETLRLWLNAWANMQLDTEEDLYPKKPKVVALTLINC